MASLTITGGADEGRRVECDRDLVIGRGDADLVVSDAEMSRRHAVLRPVEGGVEVEDLGSLNGTFVNGEQISGKVTLTESATVRIGVTEFALDVPPPEPAEPEIPAGATRIAGQPPPLDATVVRQRPPITAPPPGGSPPVGVPQGGPPPGAGPPPWVQAGGAPPGGGPPNLRGPLKLLAKTPLRKLMMKRVVKRMAKQQQSN
jgi:FHA domain